MSRRPVVFLAFANQQDSYLPLLKQEGRNIYRALQALHDKQFLELYREESADLEGLFEDFRRFKDRMVIFHYAGHAGSKHLQLEDLAAQSKGLSQLLSEATETLKLVFLNGCSTLEQVKQFHDLGVKAVIATSVSIEDKMAVEFASKFYQALANKSNLEEAFLHAKAFLASKYPLGPDTQIVRGFKWHKRPQDNPPWGLYIPEGEEAVLEWKLPQFQRVKAPSLVSGQYAVNQDMLKILEAMAEFEPELARELRNPRKAPMVIVENFPWTMGAQIRKLFANTEQMNKPGLPRLRQLIQAYAVTGQFLAYTLLAQVWDKLHSDSLPVKTDWEQLFSPSRSNFSGYDYMVLLKRCYEVLRENEVELFIPELADSVGRLQPDGASFQAYRFIESIRLRLLHQDIESDQVDQLCLECEAALVELLVRGAFLAKYKLLTIKDIRIFFPKYIDAQFNHRMGELNVAHKDYLWEEDLAMAVYTNSHSVILTHRHEEGDIQRSLNLSPFIIDKSAFVASQVPAIYSYGYKDQNRFFFRSVDYDINHQQAFTLDWLEIEAQSPDYQIVHLLFDMFQQDLMQARRAAS